MHTDEAACLRAIRAKDARFDGVFYTGVTSTGIYCRPSCPARTPQAGNVRFYPTAAAAQAAGFRACKRCLPGAAPGSPEWDVRGDTVARAMRLIDDGVVDREGVPGLAATLGYSPRQLQRLLADGVGAGPVALARTRRAHTARTLLEATDLRLPVGPHTPRRQHHPGPSGLPPGGSMSTYSIMDSPIGALTIVERDGGLAAIYMTEHRHAPGPETFGERVDDALPEVTQQLREYFDGERTVFDLPLNPVGTEFQRSVWSEMAAIPYGETLTYGDIAAALGRPSASRAVGTAVGRNPISIVVPCHRVVGSSGKLVGYAGGVDRKEYLLAHERGLMR